VELARDKQGRVTANTNGTTTWLVATAEGLLATSRGSGDLTLRVEGNVMALERDAGVRATLHRAAAVAVLPPDLAGRYANADTAATWAITATDVGAELRIAGPLVQAGPWDIAPVEGDHIRIYTPITLYRGWLDTTVRRDAGGKITGLHVDGGRVKGLVFTRLP
jgi:D-aminopeptidase